MARTDMACFAREKSFLQDGTMRLARIALPFIQVPVVIDRALDGQQYSIIKKTLYDLLTGEDPKAYPPVAYVQDRQEAFRLLGLDMAFYDVADLLFNELIAEGKIHDSPQGVLAGAAPASDPSFLNAKRATSYTCHLLINPFTNEICNDSVQKLRFYTQEELLTTFKGEISFADIPAHIHSPDTFQKAINHKNFNFENCSEESRTQQLRRQNMPLGAYGIQLMTEDGVPDYEDLWVPYYVTLERTDSGAKYHLYGCRSSLETDLFDINDPAYRDLHDFLAGQLFGHHSGDLSFPLTPNLSLPLYTKEPDTAPEAAPGITFDPWGNYVAALTDLQLARICMEQTEDVVDTLEMVTCEFGVITALEVGRLVRFSLTEGQKDLCQKILEQPEDRYALVLPLLEAAAEAGNEDAIYHLANCTFMGRGRDADPEAAFALYRQAAELGHEWAQYQLGLCYFTGMGVSPDGAAAEGCWKKLPNRSKARNLAQINQASLRIQEGNFAAARKNLTNDKGMPTDAFAAYLLASLLLQGAVFEKDEATATKYLEFAAKQGHLPATLALGLQYYQGNSATPANREKARALLEQSLQPVAQERLFFMGAKPFIPYPHLCYSRQDMESRQKALAEFQQKARDLLAKLS